MLNHCLVTQRIGAVGQDSPYDDDRLPDYLRVFGEVIFTPNMRQGDAYKITEEDGGIRIAPALKIVAQIIDGQIMHEGGVGVNLFAAGPNSNPSEITYSVTYSGLTAGGQSIQLKGLNFKAVPGETIDLGLATPVAGTPGIGIVQGPRGEKGDPGDWTLEDLSTVIDSRANSSVTTEITTQLPPKIDELVPPKIDELVPPKIDQLVPPKVAEVIGGDTIVRDAAAAAVNAEAPAAVNAAAADIKWQRGLLTRDSQLDAMRFEADQGAWRVAPESLSVDLNLPEGTRGIFTVYWIAGTASTSAIQTWEPYSGNRWVRTFNVYSATWTEWHNSTAIYTPAPPRLSTNSGELERDIAKRRAGGAIGTDGAGVVAFRFDHNARPFIDKILPLLKERGIPASQCHFIDQMNPSPDYTNDDSTGVTWANIEEYSLDAGVEVWNHGWTHQDAPTPESLEHEIVDSRDELRRVMPRIPVAGFMPPGVTGTGWMGFTSRLGDPMVWEDTEAGRLIAASHASSSGSLSTYWPLGTGSRFGFSRLSLDTTTNAATTIAVLQRAAETRQGVVFLHHPNAIDRDSGTISTSVLEEILDEVVRLRDLGKLIPMSVSGMLMADPSTPSRNDLLRNGDFSQGMNAWSGTGWTATAEGGVSTLGSSRLAQAFNVSAVVWALGGVRTFHVEAKAPEGMSITVGVEDTSTTPTFSPSRTVVATGDWQSIDLSMLLPKSGLAALRAWAQGSSGGIEIRQARLLAS